MGSPMTLPVFKLLARVPALANHDAPPKADAFPQGCVVMRRADSPARALRLEA